MLYYFLSVSKLDRERSTVENPVYVSNEQANNLLAETVKGWGDTPKTSQLVQLKTLTQSKVEKDGWFVGLVFHIGHATKSELQKLESTLLSHGHVLDSPNDRGFARALRVGLECTPD